MCPQGKSALKVEFKTRPSLAKSGCREWWGLDVVRVVLAHRRRRQSSREGEDLVAGRVRELRRAKAELECKSGRTDVSTGERPTEGREW